MLEENLRFSAAQCSFPFQLENLPLHPLPCPFQLHPYRRPLPSVHFPFWFRQLARRLTSQELRLKSGPENTRQTLDAFRNTNLNFLASETVVCFKWHVVSLSADVSGPVCFEQNNNNVHICSPFHLVILKPRVHIN